MSVFTVYKSPRIANANPQISNMRLNGMSWFLLNRDNKSIVMSSHANVRRIMQFFRVEIPSYLTINPIPTHFGYEIFNNTKELVNNQSSHLILCKLDKIYPDIYPQNVHSNVNSYTDSDFEKLTNDRTINKIYDNGEYFVWAT
ncbi:MAG: hypothetical protein GF329_20850 [Candidatus Lokiarchaeota archaeon]|nr:hypothetical protein [Candidatus Lokiarchaeota archaeon]